jgi:polygalacturonase
MASSRRDLLKAAGVLAGSTLAGGAAITQGAAAAAPAVAAVPPWDEVPTILARIVPPTFPNRVFDIRDHGAVGDNTTDCTPAIKNAIAACNAAGGGRVLVPGVGRFRTGKIHLLSNVDLHIESGGTLRFRTDTGSYLPNVFTRWQGIECYNYSPFIYANGQTNVAITGPGTIDGNAPAGSWSSWGGGGADWTLLQQQGADDTPVSQRQYGSGHQLRPNLVGIYNCTNVLLDGFTATNPAMWTIHPVYCTNVTVRGLTLRSTNSQGDGLDLDSCTDVQVSDCRMDTNDDCVVIKSGRDRDGRRVARPTQNVVVQGCKFSGRWGGITVGSEMSGGARKIFAEDCENNPADFPGRFPVKYPLYVKTNKQRGGYVDGVHLRRIQARNIERDALHITTVYNGTTSGSFPPVVQNFTVDAMTTTNGRSPVAFEGQADCRVRGVEISNSTFTGMTAANVIQFTDVHWINSSINGVPIGDPPPSGTRYEAEDAVIFQGVVESNHLGFSGTGFVNGNNVAGSYVQWSVTATAAGPANVAIRYANGTTTNRPMSVNGLSVDFPGTGNWDTWQTKTVTLNLVAGTNLIRATATTVNGGPNLDYIEVSS